MAAESKIESLTCNWAKNNGCLTYKFASPNHRGVPDRIFIGPKGHILFLEFKAPGSKPTSLQMREMERIAEKGCQVGWTDTFMDAVEMIAKLCLREQDEI